MRKRCAFALLALLLVAGTIGIWIAIMRPFNHLASPSAVTPQTVHPQAAAQVTHQPLPTTDVANIQDNMDSSDAAMQSLAWVPQLRNAYVASVKNPLPSGTKLVIDAKSFWYVKNYGEVQAIAGTSKYVLHLERSGNQWLIAWTTKQ